MRGPGKLFWKVFAGNAILMVLVLGICVWFIVKYIDETHEQSLARDLQARAKTVRLIVRDHYPLEQIDQLEDFLRSMTASESNHVQITLFASDGRILAGSNEDAPQLGISYLDEEVRQAMEQGWGKARRLAGTPPVQMLFVAVRMGSMGEPKGVVRVAAPIYTPYHHAETIQKLIWTVALIGVAAIVILALSLAQIWSKPIRRITMTARAMSRGDLSARVRVRGKDELSDLAHSLNEMSDHLAVQLAMVDRQRRTLEALLAQLHEGVIVAGPTGHIMLINPAAIRLLGLSHEKGGRLGGHYEGLLVEQCVSNVELQKLLLPADQVSEMREGDDSGREVKLPGRTKEQELTIFAKAWDIALPEFDHLESMSRFGDHPMTGRLLVLTDISRLAETMQVKADFAANASHELRTPLSAIRGAVETLLNMDGNKKIDSVRTFLEMIDKHSRRMEEMVADLLDLSRIENMPSKFRPQRIVLSDLFRELQSRHAEAMARKEVRWKQDIQCENDVVLVDPYLLRICLDNLIDNAIKFSHQGGCVTAGCREVPEQSTEEQTAIAIEIADEGIGIAEEEQKRVFERFYQVERARSGSLRGTGLGLAIVRHSVAAMHGQVSLHSEPGKGTRVTITVMRPKALAKVSARP